MNDYEEDLDDFPAENRAEKRENQPNHWLEHVAQSRQINFRQEVGSQPRFHLFLMDQRPGFKYEELIDEWLDLTVLEAEKRGPALKNPLVGDAEMYKGLLDREHLKTADGVKYFRDTLRRHFIKQAQSVFLWRFYQFNRTRRGNIEMVKWTGKFSLLLRRLKVSWMDMLPMSTLSEEQRQNQYLADVAKENAGRQTRSVELWDSNAQATRDRWNAIQVSNHERLFPFSDNLTTLMFIVASDLSEAQRETHKFLFSSENEYPRLHL